MNCGTEGALLCALCTADSSLDGPPFAYANPKIRKLICAWKYDGDEEGLARLVRLIAPRAASWKSVIEAKKIEAIVPIPLSSWKERMRGFNQAKDGARAIGELLHLPSVDLLERKHRWFAQANTSHDLRKKSFTKNPFTLRAGIAVPKRIMIFDDVETTGATMGAAEDILRDAGVEEILRISIAKG
ncbi:MAG: hypothetical protein AAB473_04815 [Patescibacteria group bacterium]